MFLFDIEPCELPPGALLGRYSGKEANDGSQAFTDCYSVQVDRFVGLQEFVLAFYTTPLFRVERLVLALIGRSSSDAQAAKLALDDQREFAAWSVEDRTNDQLLMCDFRGRTRSWFMVVGVKAQPTAATRLYFGSAVVKGKKADGGKSGMGWLFELLLGFHKLYSKALLSSARHRLIRA